MKQKLILKKHKPICSLLVILLPYVVQAQETSILWKITGNELSKPSYLFGTIHMIPKRDFFLTKPMEDAFEQSEVLVTEINMDVTLKQQLQLAQRIVLPNDKSYKDYLDEQAFAAFYSYLIDSLNIKQNKVDRYIRIKPIFLSGLIMKELLGRIKSYENEFFKIAKRNDMELLALETINEQMDIVDSISLDLQFKDLENSVSYVSDYNQLLEAYKKQELDQLCNIMEGDTDFQTVKTIMLDNRNLKWAKKIKVTISGKSCFIAIGAAHLCGNQGIIKLLEKTGYTVEPVF